MFPWRLICDSVGLRNEFSFDRINLLYDCKKVHAMACQSNMELQQHKLDKSIEHAWANTGFNEWSLFQETN